jgi:polysaccharide export outer membrane protein
MPSAVPGTNTLDDKLKLGIGDRLSYRIIEDIEDPKPLVVTDSGDIEVPLIGRIPALGKTCKQLAGEMKVKLEEEYYYHATVVLAIDLFNRSRGKVYLVGYVRVPGPQDIPSDETFTLSKAIMRAGGFAEYADKKRVRLTRKGSDAEPLGKNFEVDVGAVVEEGRADKDIMLEVGDLIYVPSRLFKF